MRKLEKPIPLLEELEELLRDEEPEPIEKDERERPEITWDTRRKPDMVRIPRSNRATRPIRRIQHRRWRSQ